MIKIITAAATIILLDSVPVHATTYGAFEDFSISSNPNGVWSYGSGTPGTSFTLFTNTAPQRQAGFETPGWYSPSFRLGLPHVYANNTGAPINVDNASFPARTLSVHPGDEGDSQAAIVRFTAPSAAIYGYDIIFGQADPAGSVGVTVYDNSTVLLARSLLSPSGIHWVGSVSLAANDVLSFVVDRNGSWLFDSTIFQAVLTPVPIVVDPGVSVPEPASFAMLTISLCCLGAMRRRR